MNRRAAWSYCCATAMNHGSASRSAGCAAAMGRRAHIDDVGRCRGVFADDSGAKRRRRQYSAGRRGHHHDREMGVVTLAIRKS
jgi:hypothetical protein